MTSPEYTDPPYAAADEALSGCFITAGSGSGLTWRSPGYDEGWQTPTRDELRKVAAVLTALAETLPDTQFRDPSEPRNYY